MNSYRWTDEESKKLDEVLKETNKWLFPRLEEVENLFPNRSTTYIIKKISEKYGNTYYGVYYTLMQERKNKNLTRKFSTGDDKLERILSICNDIDRLEIGLTAKNLYERLINEKAELLDPAKHLHWMENIVYSACVLESLPPKIKRLKIAANNYYNELQQYLTELDIPLPDAKKIIKNTGERLGMESTVIDSVAKLVSKNFKDYNKIAALLYVINEEKMKKDEEVKRFTQAEIRDEFGIEEQTMRKNISIIRARIMQKTI